MESVDFLQVGSHVGNSLNDHLFGENVINKNIILIEPVPYLFNTLKENYSSKVKKNTIQFLNIAISNKDESLTLYVPSSTNDFSKFPYWASQLASTNKDHISTHIPNLLVDTITVPCFTLNTLIEKMGIQHIDYLMVDTEGHDYDILMDLDLSKIKPKKIRFENKHMDGIFVKGIKYFLLMSHFNNHGYTVVSEDGEDTVIRL